MKNFLFGILGPGVTAVVGATLLVCWLNVGPGATFDLRTPGMDEMRVKRSTGDLQPATEAGSPVLSEGSPSEIPGAWPGFRGENHDGVAATSVPLARIWPEGGPEILWTIELGPGHAGAAVADGRVFVLDYDVQAQADTMRCLSLDDGREIWRNGYPVAVAETHGMSRTVPAVLDGRVVSFGPRCHVVCWDAATGEPYWMVDLVREYGVKVPQWHAAQCPLIEDGRVILAPCAESFMIAVDLFTGEVIEERNTPKLNDWKMTHVSIAPMDLGGRRTYVYCGSRGVAGVAADDGAVLWQSTDWVGKMATCPTPVPIGDGRIFLTSGYGAGSLMMRIHQEEDGQFTAETLFRMRPKEFEAEQHTPILFDGHLYGVRTKQGGYQLVCLDLDGREIWNSGEDKFGIGPFMIADGLIILMDDQGLLTIVEATHEQYRRLDQFLVFQDGYEAWGPMALVAGRLIVRDLTRMACLNIAE